jgi:NAD(P)-dependent dehydrogenase (short-subunit alcohol dehydrogenase family)
MILRDIGVIVTGGASGLGAATARLLADQGAKVAIFDLDERAGAEEAQRIGGLFCKVNVADEADVVKAIEQAEQRHGFARVLVNCAGISTVRKTVGRENDAHPLDVFRRTIEVNLIGSFNTISKFAARLAAWPTYEEERGVIVNTASVAAYDGQVGQVAYSASKGGIVGMTLPIARDFATHRIRVMTIAPGIFLTPMMKGLPQAAQDSLGKQVPHPSRLGRPEEYAQMVGAVVANPMLNGEVIRLDGAIRMAPR